MVTPPRCFKTRRSSSSSGMWPIAHWTTSHFGFDCRANPWPASTPRRSTSWVNLARAHSQCSRSPSVSYHGGSPQYFLFFLNFPSLWMKVASFGAASCVIGPELEQWQGTSQNIDFP